MVDFGLVMQVTPQFWATTAIGVVFGLLAVGAAQPVALIGLVGIGVWLLATAGVAVTSFQQANTHLEIEYTLDPTTTHIDTPTTATLRVRRPAQTAVVSVRVEPTLPAGVTQTTDATALTLDPGETEATLTVSLQPTVAGDFVLPAPTVALADPLGLYTEQLSAGPQPQLTVLPQTPTVHIGKGGESYGNAFGEHATDRPGPGIATRDLRQYIAGEAATNIDWKSTARLGEPYVRETEGETNRHTALLVDHRAHTGDSTTTETPLTYIREAALGMTASAAEYTDPLSLWTVGDDGLTETIAAGSTPTTYTRVRSTLLGLIPTTAATTRRAAPGHRVQTVVDRMADSYPAKATLQSYVTASTTTVDAVRDDAFVDAVHRARAQLGSEVWLVLVTTDADPARLRESVQVATQGGGAVLVLIVPTVFFHQPRLNAIQDTYDAYTTFENLRRELDSHPRVTALEVAPGDRLQALLANNRSDTHRSEGRS